MRQRRHWTHAESVELARRYPHEPTATIAIDLRRPLAHVYAKAAQLQLHKTAEYLASPHACRLRRGDNVGAAHRFRPGHVPANKGLRRPGWHRGRMAETWFKPGERHGIAKHQWVPIGSLRENADGYIDMKVREAPGSRAWRALHRILWEDAHGPIPPKHVVCFRNGDKLDIELVNLELVSRSDLARRNHMTRRLPPELVKTIRALGALKATITKREKRGRHA